MASDSMRMRFVGGHEILPSGGHVAARCGQRFCPAAANRTAHVEVHFPSGSTAAGCSSYSNGRSRQP